MKERRRFNRTDTTIWSDDDRERYRARLAEPGIVMGGELRPANMRWDPVWKDAR
jgi:hypothetical protein